MKEIILVYGEYCIGSINALSLIEKILQEKSDLVVHRIPFSFSEPLVKKYHVMITPTFIIDDKIAFVGTPEKEKLIKEISC